MDLRVKRVKKPTIRFAYTRENVTDIIKLCSDGYSISHIAKQYKTTRYYINKIFDDTFMKANQALYMSEEHAKIEEDLIK